MCQKSCNCRKRDASGDPASPDRGAGNRSWGRYQSSILYTLPKQSNNDASPCLNTNELPLLHCAETFPTLQRAIGFGEKVRMFWIRMQKSMKKVSSALNADVPLVA